MSHANVLPQARGLTARGALAAALLALAAPAFAYRPFVTDDAGVVGRGRVQLEAGLETFGFRSRPPLPVLLLTPAFGPVSRLELAIDLPLFLDAARGSYGLGDVRPIAKLSLFEERGARPALAIAGFYKDDNGDEGQLRGTRWREAGGYAVTTKTWGAWQVHAALGATEVDGEGVSHLHFGAALDHRSTAAGRPLHLLAEVFGSGSPDVEERRAPAGAYAGAQYELVEDALLIDAGAGAGLTSSASPWRLSVGATLRR